MECNGLFESLGLLSLTACAEQVVGRRVLLGVYSIEMNGSLPFSISSVHVCGLLMILCYLFSIVL
jgi:hypothetical protein